MACLYRTPNIRVDQHEWHAAVECRDGRTARVYYRFRPFGERREMWRPIDRWEGRKPKALNRFFRPFWKHIELARVQGR
jgi:hypothetical protein